MTLPHIVKAKSKTNDPVYNKTMIQFIVEYVVDMHVCVLENMQKLNM